MMMVMMTMTTLMTRDHANNQMESVPFNSDLTKLEPWASDTMSRTDLPRLRAGKVYPRFIVTKTISMIIIISTINWVGAEFWSANIHFPQKNLYLFNTSL